MPICSYLVFPQPGTRQKLAETLSQLPGCQVLPADNREDVMVLVTETETPAEEDALQNALKAMADIQCLVLTFGEVAEETVR